MSYNRQGPSRRHPTNSNSNTSARDAFFEMDFSTTTTSSSNDFGGGGGGGGGNRSTTATPGPSLTSSTSYPNPYASTIDGFGGSMDTQFGNGSGGGFTNPFPSSQPQVPFSSSSSGGGISSPFGAIPQTQSPFGVGGGMSAFGGAPSPLQSGGVQDPFGGASAGIAGSMAGAFVNQQFLMATGQQLLSNPVTAAAIDTYSQSLMDKSKTWIGSLKTYFAVDTNYVVKKLILIFLPFLHKDWSIRYSTENVAPRDEPNLPDLYIPSMAFITYCLLSGYILGLQNRFAPEQLGIYASFAFAWLLLEVFIVLIAKYVLNMQSVLGFFHLIAFGGYKFVCIVAIMLFTLTLGQMGYTASFIYTTVTLMYFLLRTLNANLQTTNSASYSTYETARTGQYLIIFICLFQPVVMWFLTNGFKQVQKTNTI